ncbi:MAG: hypothetical protein DME49_08115 [Verrucomicrobia bacterium]|nr:MAG: hypothetical protein DME49_08115 [Verrucomicrobiota bacterium]
MGWIKDIYDVVTDLISRAARHKKRARIKQKHAEEIAKLEQNSGEEIARVNQKRRNWVMDWKRWR